jgi:copper(I)-binding protein
MLNRRAFFLSTLAIPVSVRAHAHSYTVGAIAIGHVWGLPSETNETQVFAPFVNRGNAADQLVAARSSICSMIELRQNNRYDDPPLKSIELQPGKPLAMRKGARHLRLIGLTRALKAGDRFDMILDFLNAGEATVEVIVEDGPGH